MATPNTFLRHSLRIFQILFCVICYLSLAHAQHGGGGGGHSGGGHSGGGHSSSTHSSGGHSSGNRTGGHFGWLHFGKHAGGHPRAGRSSASDTSLHLPSTTLNYGALPRRPSIPATFLWTPTLLAPRRDGRVFFSPSLRRQHPLLFNRFPFASSGCFFNGVTQFCFFEPFFPLLSCAYGFGFFGSGFGGDFPDLSASLDAQGLGLSEMSAVPSATSSDDVSADDTPGARPRVAPAVIADQGDPGKGAFVLVLNDGATRTVTDYWVADGYLEYISPDGTRSHIPLDAIDLQSTVTQNAPRGLPFVLRSAPVQNR